MKRLLNFLSQARLVIGMFLKKYWEYINIIVTVVLMVKTPEIIRSFAANAAPIDPGVLSAAVYGILTAMMIKSITWLLINTIWPLFADYSQSNFKTDFQTLTPWQKVKVYLLVYFSIAALVLLSVKVYL